MYTRLTIKTAARQRNLYFPAWEEPCQIFSTTNSPSITVLKESPLYLLWRCPVIGKSLMSKSSVGSPEESSCGQLVMPIPVWILDALEMFRGDTVVVPSSNEALRPKAKTLIQLTQGVILASYTRELLGNREFLAVANPTANKLPSDPKTKNQTRRVFCRICRLKSSWFLLAPPPAAFQKQSFQSLSCATDDDKFQKT
jgi:hypothetical protein